VVGIKWKFNNHYIERKEEERLVSRGKKKLYFFLSMAHFNLLYEWFSSTSTSLMTVLVTLVQLKQFSGKSQNLVLRTKVFINTSKLKPLLPHSLNGFRLNVRCG